MAHQPARKPGEWLRSLRASSTERVRVQLCAEVLVSFPVAVFVHGSPGFVGPEMLGISSELENDLVVWLRWWQERVGLGDDDDDDEADDVDEEWRGWQEEGALLLERLKLELGDDCDVDWV